ncbi:MAG: hypothetical protein AB7V50_08715, partial [Vampirovibrionia bacterium]
MHKILLIVILSLSINSLFCQMPTNGDYTNWNWEDQSLDNWKRAESESATGWVMVNPPFLPETPAFGDMIDIIETQDYSKAKGWRL